VEALLADKVPFDAIFAASDLIAIGAMRALAAAGLRVPDDVAVVGFDDQPAASMTNPPLTTVMQDLKGAGELLVDTLLAQIEDRATPDQIIATRLIVRRSTTG
ncbi:MAG: substrate-binding domain-containing protein, partial [Proteobacteria bacterium]|nr:substrate-binding domain-containing protein [Pseudomonadota bacterium]